MTIAIGSARQYTAPDYIRCMPAKTSVTLMVVFFSMLFGTAAESESIDAFAQQLRASYKRQDAQWLLARWYTNAPVRPEIDAKQRKFVELLWQEEELEVTKLEWRRFNDYKPRLWPGVHESHATRYMPKPTHVLVFEADTPVAKKKKQWSSFALNLPIALLNGRWMICARTCVPFEFKHKQ